MGKLKTAEEILAKLAKKSLTQEAKLSAAALKRAEAMGLDVAKLDKKQLQALEKVSEMVPAGLSDAEYGELREAIKGPKTQEYLDALDTISGDRNKRAADLNFNSESWYHGSSDPDIESFKKSSDREELGSGVYLASDKKDAKGFQGQNGKVYQVKVAGKTYDFGSDAPGPVIKELKKMGWKREDFNAFLEQGHLNKNNIFGANEEQVQRFKDFNLALENAGYAGTISSFDNGAQLNVVDPSKIRSVDAAFDPAYKKSRNILAGAAGLVGAGTVLAPTSEAQASDYISLPKSEQQTFPTSPQTDKKELLKQYIEDQNRKIDLARPAFDAAGALGSGLEWYDKHIQQPVRNVAGKLLNVKTENPSDKDISQEFLNKFDVLKNKAFQQDGLVENLAEEATGFATDPSTWMPAGMTKKILGGLGAIKKEIKPFGEVLNAAGRPIKNLSADNARVLVKSMPEWEEAMKLEAKGLDSQNAKNEAYKKLRQLMSGNNE